MRRVARNRHAARAALVLAVACWIGAVCAAGPQYVRVTQSGGLGGITVVTSMAETPAGTVCVEEVRNPLRPAPAVRQRVLPPEAFARTVERLKSLGLEQLESFRQRGIEDAPSYEFEATLGPRTVRFTVVGELKDLDDRRYHRILKTLRDPEALETQP